MTGLILLGITALWLIISNIVWRRQPAPLTVPFVSQRQIVESTCV